MGKKWTTAFSLILSCVSFSSFSYAASYQNTDLVTIYGRPNEKLDFVKQMVRESVIYDSQLLPEQEISTQLYSLLNRKGIKHTVSIEIIKEDGSVPGDIDFYQVIFDSAKYAPIVHNILGGSNEVNNLICKAMSKHPQIVFVTPSGNEASAPTPDDLPHCSAPNIIRYTSLNKEKNDVAESANYGLTVRIAAPRSDLTVIDVDGKEKVRTSSAFAGALVSANLAIYAKQHPNLKGGTLAKQFLLEKTVHIPALSGKVEGGRAILE